MKIVNLTPHAIVIRTTDGDVTHPPSGNLARVEAVTTPSAAGHALGVPVVLDEAGAVVGLPPEVTEYPTWDGYSEPPGGYDDTPTPGPHAAVYLVSGMVLAALRAAGCQRRDVFAPGTGPADGPIRNDRGHIAAVTRLKGLV